MLATLEKLLNVKSLATILISIFFSAFTSLSILLLAPDYFLVFVVVLVPFVIIFVLKKPIFLLQILILIIPFSNMDLINMQIIKIPGLKVINILFVLTFIAFILTHVRTNITLLEKVFIVGMLSFLLIAVTRSIPQLPIINFELNENFDNVRFFQSYFLKSVIYFSFFIFISLYVSDFEKIELLLKTFIFSLFTITLSLLIIYIFFTPNKSNFQIIRESYSSIIRLHGNNLATIYLISFPILISYHIIKKNVFSFLSLILSVITIGFLYSRTAYLLLLLSVFIYLFISKRFKWIPIACGVMLITAIFLPSSISERAMTGLESKDVSDISAGRVRGIWIPLVHEVLESPKKLFFGSGMRAMLFSDSYQAGHIYRTGHAHSLYLNAILEIGLLGLTFFALLYIIFLKNIFKAIKRNRYSSNENELLFGVVVATLSYLIAGITSRHLFPVLYNYPFWLMLAFGFAILKIQAKKETI